MRLGRAWFAAPLLAAVLLVAVAGPVPAAGGGEASPAVSAEASGSVLAVTTAQSGTDIDPDSDTEPRLVGRESSERVDAVVIALWSIAAGMSVMLVLFLWHTSPRRRLRLARRRSTELYDGETDQAAAATGADSADDAEVVDDAAAAAEAAEQDEEAVAVVASGADEEAVAVVASGAGEDPPEVVASGAGEDPPEVEEPELPPVWEDEAGPAGEGAEPADRGSGNEPPAAGTTTKEGRPGFWLQLRRTLGLD